MEKYFYIFCFYPSSIPQTVDSMYEKYHIYRYIQMSTVKINFVKNFFFEKMYIFISNYSVK